MMMVMMMMIRYIIYTHTHTHSFIFFYDLLKNEEYDDSKQVVDIPSNAPSTPPANLDPEMVRALEVFPQWTQEQIQEYFDMGWNVETLLEWVNEQ